jgi:hypothetical protein
MVAHYEKSQQGAEHSVAQQHAAHSWQRFRNVRPQGGLAGMVDAGVSQVGAKAPRFLRVSIKREETSC